MDFTTFGATPRPRIRACYKTVDTRIPGGYVRVPQPSEVTVSKKTKEEYERLLVEDADAAIEARDPLYLREPPADPSKVPSGSWWWNPKFGNRNRKVSVTHLDDGDYLLAMED